MSKLTKVEQYVPEQALQSYLDSMLQEAAASLAEPEPVVVVTAELAVETPPVAALPRHMPLASQPPAVPPAVSDAPVWREQPFEALLFDVAGLSLAVPLLELGSIHTLDSEITPLFGQPGWFLGLLSTPAGNLKVVDTARLVMPERYRPELRDNIRYVISIQGCDWALAVHAVRESIHLTQGQIKWRSQQGKRAWLAGTVIEHMCALLDVSQLSVLLDSGSRTGKGGTSALG